MKVAITWSCISSVANISNHFTALDSLSLRYSARIAVEMTIIIDIAARWIRLIKHYAATIALMELHHYSVISSDDRRISRRHDIQGLVYTAFGTCVVKGIMQLS